MRDRVIIGTAALLWAAASCASHAADLPRGAGAGYAGQDGPGRGYVGLGYVVGEAPVTRYVDPIQVGRVLPHAIPLMPMPRRYGVIGYGYTVVNGKPLLVDHDTREIVEVLPEQ